MAGSKKRKGSKAGRTNKKKQRQDDQSADEQKQIELPAVPQPLISRLYRDALQSVFKFCGLADLGRVLAVSRNWSETVRVMPSIGARVDRPSLPPLTIALSGLTTHIRKLGSINTLLDCKDLFIIAKNLNSLTAMACRIAMPQPQVAPFVFSHKLTVLTLKFDGEASAAASINEALVTISRLPNLIFLEVEVKSFFAPLSFQCLSGAPALNFLYLRSDYRFGQLNSVQIDQLRALRRLHTMNVAFVSNISLARLLRMPHALQWKKIHTPNGLDAIGSAALSSSPSLTALHTLRCEAVGFLAHLVQLRTLDLHMAQKPWPATITADAIVAGLSCCTQLTELKITAPLNSKHLSTLLPRLPLLTKLTLLCMLELESLAFLNSGPIVHRLRSLHLEHCRHASLHSSELKHVYALQVLEELTVTCSLVEPLTPLELFPHLPHMYTSVMPKLKTFSYTEP